MFKNSCEEYLAVLSEAIKRGIVKNEHPSYVLYLGTPAGVPAMDDEDIQMHASANYITQNALLAARVGDALYAMDEGVAISWGTAVNEIFDAIMFLHLAHSSFVHMPVKTTNGDTRSALTDLLIATADVSKAIYTQYTKSQVDVDVRHAAYEEVSLALVSIMENFCELCDTTGYKLDDVVASSAAARGLTLSFHNPQ